MLPHRRGWTGPDRGGGHHDACTGRVRAHLVDVAIGAILGFLIALSIDLGELGYVNLYKGYALIPVDVLAETGRTALAGGVIAGSWNDE